MDTFGGWPILRAQKLSPWVRPEVYSFFQTVCLTRASKHNSGQKNCLMMYSEAGVLSKRCLDVEKPSLGLPPSFLNTYRDISDGTGAGDNELEMLVILWADTPFPFVWTQTASFQLKSFHRSGICRASPGCTCPHPTQLPATCSSQVHTFLLFTLSGNHLVLLITLSCPDQSILMSVEGDWGFPSEIK